MSCNLLPMRLASDTACGLAPIGLLTPVLLLFESADVRNHVVRFCWLQLVLGHRLAHLDGLHLAATLRNDLAQLIVRLPLNVVRVQPGIVSS